MTNSTALDAFSRESGLSVVLDVSRAPLRIDRLSPSDLPALHALYGRVFGEDVLRDYLGRWEWQFQRNPRRPSDGPEIRVARLGSDLVGHYSTIPVRLRLADRSLECEARPSMSEARKISVIVAKTAGVKQASPPEVSKSASAAIITVVPKAAPSSQAASGWAATALALACEPAPEKSARK